MLGFVLLPLCLLVITLLLTFSSLNAFRSQSEDNLKGDRVVTQTHLIKKLMLDLEEALRAYALTQDPIFLNQYEHAHENLDPQIAKLKEMLGNDGTLVMKVEQASTLSKKWRDSVQLSTMKNKVYNPATFNKDPALKQRMLDRKDTMAQFQEDMNGLIQDEQNYKEKRLTEFESDQKSFTSAMSFLYLVIGFLILFSGRAHFKNLA